jgi:argininosuccinate lyase
VLTLMKGLPMTYNRDLQEDKEAVFDAWDTVRQSTRLLARMIPRMAFKTERMKGATAAGYLLATDLADYLTTKGVDFRTAHEVVGKLVARAIADKKELEELPLSLLREFHPAFGPDVRRWLDLDLSLARRKSRGGTAPGQVRQALKAMEKKICRSNYPF